MTDTIDAISCAHLDWIFDLCSQDLFHNFMIDCTKEVSKVHIYDYLYIVVVQVML